MAILNIAGYRFIELTDLTSLKQHFLHHCEQLGIKGTIILSHEGINLEGLAGTEATMTTFKAILARDSRFANILLHESLSNQVPFKKLKVKIKKEIITFKQPTPIHPLNRAPSVDPLTLKQWLDEKKEITLLDTRNQYEIEFGTFENAINPHINHFTQLVDKTVLLDPHKPVVMFCTGGIRCEKAACYFQTVGFQQVYQLDGGILGYFKAVGKTHWQGTCFVFDERIALDSRLTAVQQTEHHTRRYPDSTL